MASLSDVMGINSTIHKIPHVSKPSQGYGKSHGPFKKGQSLRSLLMGNDMLSEGGNPFVHFIYGIKYRSSVVVNH
jgi:hypothetical protein